MNIKTFAEQLAAMLPDFGATPCVKKKEYFLHGFNLEHFLLREDHDNLHIIRTDQDTRPLNATRYNVSKTLTVYNYKEHAAAEVVELINSVWPTS